MMNQFSDDDNNSKRPAIPPPIPGRSFPPPVPAAQGTVFRSVSMMVAPPVAHSFHSAPPPPKTFFKSHSTPLNGNPIIDKESATDDWVWKINKLEPVPIFHPLERTAVHLQSIPVDTVTSRISAFLKSKSITSSYQEAYVDCLTETLLQFSIRLWQGSGNSTVIIETQRRQGCCIEMQTVRAQIVEAAQHGNVNSVETTATANRRVVQMLMTSVTLPSPIDEDCFGSALGINQRMLESKRLDENRLALESLCTLTDPSKVMSGDAEKAAKLILSDRHVQGLLEKHFSQVKLSKHESAGLRYEDSTVQYEDGHFAGCMHILALRLLCNALELASVVRPAIDLKDGFWPAVLQALYYNVNVASRRPLEASLSIKCMRLLQSFEPFTMDLLPDESQLHEILMTAHQFGRQHNRSLELESERLLGRLGLPVY